MLFARRHELPPDQLILERPGEAPDGGAVERRAGRGGISRVEQQPAVPSDRRRQSGRTRRRRASEYRPDQARRGGVAREPESVDGCQRPFRRRALLATRLAERAPSPRSEPLGRGTLDDDASEAWRSAALSQQSAQGRDCIERQSIVADAEQKLVKQILDPVDHRRGADQQDGPADQPRCDVPVASGGGIPEVVRLVDQHRAPRRCRDAPAAGGLVRRDDRADAARRWPPLATARPTLPAPGRRSAGSDRARPPPRGRRRSSRCRPGRREALHRTVGRRVAPVGSSGSAQAGATLARRQPPRLAPAASLSPARLAMQAPILRLEER